MRMNFENIQYLLFCERFIACNHGLHLKLCKSEEEKEG
jgi:hypothetical protein